MVFIEDSHFLLCYFSLPFYFIFYMLLLLKLLFLFLSRFFIEFMSIEDTFMILNCHWDSDTHEEKVIRRLIRIRKEQKKEEEEIDKG